MGICAYGVGRKLGKETKITLAVRERDASLVGATIHQVEIDASMRQWPTLTVGEPIINKRDSMNKRA